MGHTIPGKVVINRANAFNLFAVRVHQATDNVDYVDDNSVGDVGTQNSTQVKELCRKGGQRKLEASLGLGYLFLSLLLSSCN